MDFDDKLKAELARIAKGGAPKYHQKNAETGKLFARERVRLLLDADSFIEDGAFANATDPELPADGVITGLGKIGGRLVAAMANDSTVKAGSWGRRMAEMVIGGKVTLEELGGARMHCSVSGCGDALVKTEQEAIEAAKRYLSYFPENFSAPLPVQKPVPPASSGKRIEEIIPPDQNKFFDMFALIRELIDADSLFELKKLFAPEVITAFARIEGKPVGIVASQPKHKGGVLFVDSADKAARFIWLCDAFGIPILYLADVPGFMIGTKV